MTDMYDELSDSREHAAPVNLLLFRYGSAALSVFGYTDAEQAITKDGVIYEPVPVDAGSITASGTLDRKALELKVPSRTGIAALYLAYPPSYPISLTIFRGQMNEAGTREYRSIWVGRVLNGKHEGDGSHWCALTCEPIATSLRRTALRRCFQFLCPHVLYGLNCKANKGAATFTVIPAVIGGNTIGLDAGWAPDSLLPGFSNGVIEWTTANGNVEIRSILDIEVPGDGADHTLHMTGPTTGLVAQSVRISLGCNHQMSHCNDLHSNIQNFGGQPWIPGQNPIGGAVNTFG